MMKPSDVHPCLTDERIDYVGQLIARVRAENLEAVEARDNSWSIGCRAYAWICSEILSQVKSQEWLSVVDPSLHFVAKIGNVEFGFYRGQSDKPKSNIFSRAQAHPELNQSSFSFDLPIPEKMAWVYAVETDLEGMTTKIEFLGLSEAGEVVASRAVPIFALQSTPVGIENLESAAVELPPAVATLPKHKKTIVAGSGDGVL